MTTVHLYEQKNHLSAYIKKGAVPRFGIFRLLFMIIRRPPGPIQCRRMKIHRPPGPIQCHGRKTAVTLGKNDHSYIFTVP